MAQRYNGRRDDGRSYGPLQCAHLVLLGVGAQNELYVATPAPLQSLEMQGEDQLQIVPECADEMAVLQPQAQWQALQPQVDNKLQQLLLPTCTPQADLDELERHREREALLVWDAQGRLHQAVLDECIFLQWMRLWAPPRYLKARVWLERCDHDETRLYAAPPHAQLLLRLPPNAPDEFRAWCPRAGYYDLEYDQLGRVFSVFSADHTSVADAVQIQLGGLWEPRLHPLPLARDKK